MSTNVESLPADLEAGWNYAHPDIGHDVVISGMAGSLPSSENITVFADKLFNKVDLTSDADPRWVINHPDIPKRIGILTEINKFDASFFNLHHKQVICMDPMFRLLLEKTFEAIIDAGLNPLELKGTRTGVFVGICFSESEQTWFYEKAQSHAMCLTGCSRALAAQRIAFWLGVVGPTANIDTACSSTMYAIDRAYKAIHEGVCDAAVVGGCNLCLNPYVSLQFSRLGVLNPDGKCKCFDESANGYTRSEATVVIILQKSKDAKRIYAHMVHSKSNCDGYKAEGITYPSGEVQQLLLEDFYKECDVDPKVIGFVEAHGTGTKVGDPEEIKALNNIFCKDRETPLLIGSVKSSIGHSEPVSGLCSVVKVIIAMETGYIPPNINFNHPRREMIPITEGKMIVVTEKTKWDLGYASVNNFGFGGGNAHTLLKTNSKEKVNGGVPKDDLPRLVYVSGRTREAVESLLNDVGSRPLDSEQVRLLQEAFKYGIPGHFHRGFGIYISKQELKRHITTYDDVPKSVWYLFGGHAKEWIGFGNSLMKIPAFASTINMCQQVLSKTGIDLVKIISGRDMKVLDDNANVVVSTTAIQLGLIDLLATIDITPQGMVGASVGQIACAYADGCLNLEQAILTSYHVGLHLNNEETQSKLLSEIKKIIPTPQQLSSKWFAPQKQQFCTPEYLIEQTLNTSITLPDKLPQNSVVLEIHPRSQIVPNSISLVGKTQDNINVLLTAIGQLYLSGCNPRIERIYPAIQFPVSRGTPMMSHLIKWDHSKDWFIMKFRPDTVKSGERIFTLRLREDFMEFYSGHVIDGRILFPATGYLFLVWETLAIMLNAMYLDMAVVFEDIKFLRATNIVKENPVLFTIVIQKASRKFEVTESGQVVVKGRIRIPENSERETLKLPLPTTPVRKDFIPLSKKDIYKELKLRGYNYTGLFRGLHSCDTTATIGELEWKDNFVSFMDTMLQMQILRADTRGLYVPTSIDKVVIDTFKHKSIIESLKDGETIPIHVFEDIQRIQAGGIVMTGLGANAIPRRKPLAEPVLETYKFIPNVVDNLCLEDSVRIMVQLAFENIQNIKIKTIEYIDECSKEEHPLLSTLVQSVLGDLPLVRAEINVLTTKPMEETNGIEISDKKLAQVSESDCLLVIATNIIERPSVLEAAVHAAIPEGFIIAREELHVDPSNVDLTGVLVVLEHRLNNEKIVLLKKTNDKKSQTTVNVSKGANDFKWLPLLQTAVKNDPNTIVYSQNDELSGVVGLVNCIRREPGTDNVRCVFIMDKKAPEFDLNNDFYSNHLKKGLAINVLKDGRWGTYRHLLLPNEQNFDVEHAYVNVTTRGDLSSLRWLEGHLQSDINLKANQFVVDIYYSALNFRDIMTATGRLAPEVIAKGRFNQECVQGLEFAGRFHNGRRVMGIVGQCGLATKIIPDPELLWDCPDNFTLEDACTMPITYCTVYYGLVGIAKMKRGQTVLIHSGAGGVGQAAINMALHYGLKVYTTVGTQEKREFIKTNWPQIEDNQIGNSRDLSFERMITRETDGRGVDIVLNSLSEEKLQASVRCLAYGGKFLEIGKFDLSKNNPVRTQFILKGASIHGIMLDYMFSSSKVLKYKLRDALTTLMKVGAMKPLQRTVFQKHEVEDAFRYMATGKHMGKVLIKVRDEEPGTVIAEKRLFTAIRRHFSTSDGSYVITGGLGGFGLELADWLVLRGTRNLVLTSRKGMVTGYQAYRIKIWRSYGCNVKISTADITTGDGCRRLIEEAQELGPVEGVFNLAVVLKDAILQNQTEEDYITSFGPKPIATKHLDEITRRMCPNLKLFVVFSSVSCGRGNAGQTNYGMGNSIMERICEKRRTDGYPGLAIEWGAIGEVGLVAEMQEDHLELEIGGTLQQRISSCLSVLDKFLKQDDPIVSSMVVAEKRANAGAGGSIVDAVGNILGIRDVKTVSFHSSLAELGMDSIMAVEIKQTLEREFEVFLTPQDIRSLTFARLQEIASEKETNESQPSNSSVQDITAFALMIRIVGFEQSTKEIFRILPSQAPVDCKNKVILIPGIEGVANVLEPLAKHMKAQAVCMQFGFENPTEEIQVIAEQLYDTVLQHLNDTDTFNLVGYSYGSAITLELAALLEKTGRIGNVILLDGSPTTLRDITHRQLMSNTESQFQNIIITTVLGYYVGANANISDIVSAFQDCETWDEKIDMAMQKAPKDLVHCEQHQRDVCSSIYRRLKAIEAYESTVGVLKSKIKLIKPTLQTLQSALDDLGLSVFSEHPIEIVYVKGDHVTMLENPECVEEVNNVVGHDFVQFKETVVPDVGIVQIREELSLA